MSSVAVSEVPKAPSDPEQRNVIDKLAHFVAKNGPSFENMTKQKQQNNPKFAFLFGGPEMAYYHYMVATEQALIRKRQQEQQGYGPPPQSSMGGAMAFNPRHPPPGPPPHLYPPPNTAPPHLRPGGPALPQDPDAQAAMLKDFEKQIQDSENNLKAQHDVLMQQQEKDMDVKIQSCEEEKVAQMANNSGLPMDELRQLLDQLTVSCSKDAIASTKQWIFNKCSSDWLQELVLKHVLLSVSNPDSTSQRRLHLLYLLNDWAHHCMRKKMADVTKLLGRYVPLTFSIAWHFANANGETTQIEKLGKLSSLWQTQKYFQDDAYKALHDLDATYKNWKQLQLANNEQITQEVKNRVQQTYQKYSVQHNDFCRHAQNQINALKTMLQFHEQHKQDKPAPTTGHRRSRFDQTAEDLAKQEQHDVRAPPPSYNTPPPFSAPPPSVSHAPPSWQDGPPPPVRASHTNGGPPTDPDHPSLVPKLVYYDLPAALICPLIKLSDADYKPLDPSKLRLPAPQPPSDKLLQALETFYSLPSHDCPRDSEGWERLGLYEYYKEKQKAAADAKRGAGGGGRSRSRSRTRSRSRSASRSSRSASRSRSRSRSRSSSGSSHSRSRSRSPQQQKKRKSRFDT